MLYRFWLSILGFILRKRFYVKVILHLKSGSTVSYYGLIPNRHTTALMDIGQEWNRWLSTTPSRVLNFPDHGQRCFLVIKESEIIAVEVK